MIRPQLLATFGAITLAAFAPSPASAAAIVGGLLSAGLAYNTRAETATRPRVMTDGGTQTTLALEDTDRDSETITSGWEALRTAATINHETTWWELTHCDTDADADRDYEQFVSWTTNFLGVVDHDHEWTGQYSAVWGERDATAGRVMTDGGTDLEPPMFADEWPTECSNPDWSDNCNGDLETERERKKGLCEGCMAVIRSWSDDDDDDQDDGTEQATLVTDGGMDIPDCDRCDDDGDVHEAPEAGYWTCFDCLARGSGTTEPIWWHNDPESWHYETDDRELVTDGGTDDTRELKISARQRARFERVKAECTDDHLPEPTDDQILKSLIDTWDAVADGFYSDDETSTESEQQELVTDGGVPSSSGPEQTRLDVGDTRKPALIKEAQRVTTGDLAALAMCAHRYDPADVRGWYTHEFDDVLRQWICSNVESVIARLSPHCEYTRGECFPLHPADDLWVGESDTGPDQTTLVTDGGQSLDELGRRLGPHRVPRIECGKCGHKHHIDATTGEFQGHCSNCYGFLRRPTDTEQKKFYDFMDWNVRHSEPIGNDQKLVTDGGTDEPHPPSELDREDTVDEYGTLNPGLALMNSDELKDELERIVENSAADGGRIVGTSGQDHVEVELLFSPHNAGIELGVYDDDQEDR